MKKVKLGEYTKIKTGKLDANASSEKGKFPFFTCSVTPLKIDSYSYDCECVLVAGNGDLNVKYYNGKFDAYQRTYIIESVDKKELSVPYLYCFLDKYIETLREQSIGGVIKYIKLGNLTEAVIPLPSLEEQKEIVGRLDKVSSLIEKHKTQLEKLDQLTKSRFIEIFGDPVNNTMGWSTKQLQELVTDDCTISYGIVQTGDDKEEGVPVFRPVDIVNRIPVRSELKKTTEEISNKYKRTILKGREMLITVRANIADTCIVGEEFVGCNVGRGIVPIRTREDEMILEFLKYQIDSKHLNDNIKALAKGITLIQLNMEDLREVALIVPPIEKQKSFIEFAKQTDKLKLVIQKSIEKLEALKKVLMQQYFG